MLSLQNCTILDYAEICSINRSLEVRLPTISYVVIQNTLVRLNLGPEHRIFSRIILLGT
jgi:hypothetical protein